MEDLFSSLVRENLKKKMPLAARMRPETLAEILGQKHILGPGMLLRRAIENDQLGSLIFYGPPGTGKTTLALVISRATKAEFIKINAVTSGVAELRQAVKEAGERLKNSGQGTIVFIDEIHRFNKSQQDALLPSVEEGKIVLYRTEVAEEALRHLARAAGGDVRQALNGLELAVTSTRPDEKGIRHVGLAEAEESIQQRAVLYDKAGDQHYDVISAFIKSVRGSDADVALHYLARMIEAGEDHRFIMRRILILAAEDIGPAAPEAMGIAAGAAQALEMAGMPEGRIIMANIVVYLCNAPKSNAAYLGLGKALEDVRQGRGGPVPPHLRDSHYPGAAKLGRGLEYRYPHSFGGWVEQQYLPDSLAGTVYYEPTGQGKDRGAYYKGPEPEKK